MEKRRFLVLGLVLLFLVLITCLAGCNNEPNYTYEYVFKNRSSYVIRVDIGTGYDVKPKSFTIKPGTDKRCGGNTSYDSGIAFIYYRADTGDVTGVRWDGNAATFYNQ